MADGTLTWLGHATFRIDTPGGKRIYIDPFLNGNPKCPEGEQTPERVDVIAITHGHGDHVGDTVELSKKFGCDVVAPVELADWLRIEAGRRRTRARPEQGRHRRGRRASSSRSRTPTTRARRPTTAQYTRRAVRHRRHARGRHGGLLRRRHLRLRRHAADRAASTSRTSRCCRSATTTRWARARPPLRSSCWARSAASRATGAPSRAHGHARTRCASSPRSVEILDVEPGGTVEL